MIFDIHKIHPRRANSSAEFAALKRSDLHSTLSALSSSSSKKLSSSESEAANPHRPKHLAHLQRWEQVWCCHCNIRPRSIQKSAVLSESWAFLLTLQRTRGRRKPQELAHPAFKNGTQDGEAGVMSITAQPATYSGESLSCLHLMHLELVVSEPGKARTAPSCNFVHLTREHAGLQPKIQLRLLPFSWLFQCPV